MNENKKDLIIAVLSEYLENLKNNGSYYNLRYENKLSNLENVKILGITQEIHALCDENYTL